MRSSPGSLRPASRLRWRASLPARWAAAAFGSCSDTSASSARESVIRAALFAARCRASLWQSEEEPWRERPRCARPKWPRACPEGSFTPWLSLSLRESDTACSAAGSAACLPHRTRSIATQIFRTIRSCSSGKCWPPTARVRARFRGHLCPGNGGARGLHSMSTCGRRGDHIWRDVNAVGHHDDDAASVLGTVQGAALRSARAYARPSGLDGACAQMIGRHLRDGHHMLFPSGTSGALIHPSNGREKR